MGIYFIFMQENAKFPSPFRMRSTVNTVGGNTKRVRVTYGLAVRGKHAGGGGTTHAWGCHAYQKTMRHGFVLFVANLVMVSL